MNLSGARSLGGYGLGNLLVLGWHGLAGSGEAFECLIDLRNDIPREYVWVLYDSGHLYVLDGQ